MKNKKEIDELNNCSDTINDNIEISKINLRGNKEELISSTKIKEINKINENKTPSNNAENIFTNPNFIIENINSSNSNKSANNIFHHVNPNLSSLNSNQNTRHNIINYSINQENNFDLQGKILGKIF